MTIRFASREAAALHAVRARNPERLICAVPVAPPSTLIHLGPYAEEIVCLEAPENFYAVGQFYDEFGQVDDEELVCILASATGPMR